MFTVELRVGRLLEARVASPVSLDEVAAFRAAIGRSLVGRMDKVLICCDLRGARVFPPDVSEALVSIMRSDNPHFERSAFLTGESATFGLQLDRMIRDAGGRNRRVFRSEWELGEWLGEPMLDEERLRLREFLASA